MAEYLRPQGIDDALTALAAGTWTVLAGGTDFYPARVGRPVREDVLDITAIAALKGIAEDAGGWRIKALATWSDLLAADLPPLFDGLKAAAREIGGVQIQNAGTVCGNICNASPAADGVPPLLTLDAEVELAGCTDAVPLADFITGNRRTRLEPGQLVTALRVPRPEPEARGHFVKLGARRYLVISIAMAAALIVPDAKGRVTRAAVAVGACSEVACRIPALEAALAGRPLSALSEAVEDHMFAHLAPIDDMRADAGYRRDVAPILVRRMLAEVATWT